MEDDRAAQLMGLCCNPFRQPVRVMSNPPLPPPPINMDEPTTTLCIDHANGLRLCSALPSGWSRSPQRGGPGGGNFNDLTDLERLSGRAADEFKLVDVEFFVWAAIGGIVCTYRNVIDGTIVHCPRRGRLGDPSRRMHLNRNEWITSAVVRVGDSQHRSGAICVDRLKMMAQDGSIDHTNDLQVAGTTARGACHPFFQGSLKVELPESTERPSVAPTERGTIRVDGVRRHGSSRVGRVVNGQVVRAMQGRAGDSLDALCFVVGPPIPEVWSPETHARHPQRLRLTIRAVLLASRRPGNLLHKLDSDTLSKLLELIGTCS